MGPDGKLYFSIGDRGLNVEDQGRQARSSTPTRGAVLRCDPDGSNLEVVATGLRNPQELAFDELRQPVHGGQQLRRRRPGPAGSTSSRAATAAGAWATSTSAALGNRGPWNAEKIWHLPHARQPAYIVPPLAHITAGPSGLRYDPGDGLPERYADHFFVVRFPRQPGGSGVCSFAVKPKGAVVRGG